MEKREGMRTRFPVEIGIMNITACTRLIISTCFLLGMSAAQAGETFSQTFYTGENSALDQARTQAIHFQHYASTKAQQPGSDTSAGLTGLLVKALTPSRLERPVHTAGFTVQTQSNAQGFELSASYRF